MTDDELRQVAAALDILGRQTEARSRALLYSATALLAQLDALALGGPGLTEPPAASAAGPQEAPELWRDESSIDEPVRRFRHKITGEIRTMQRS